MKHLTTEYVVIVIGGESHERKYGQAQSKYMPQFMQQVSNLQ